MTHLTHSGWHHLVAAYDNGTLTFYVDGAQAGNSISYTNSGEIELFGSFDGGYQYAPADEMDNIRVYSKVLTAQEISDLYAAEQPAVPTPETTLEGHWSFDNGDATADVGDDGANSGATFVTDAGRTVATFDGANDYIQIPDPAALSGDTWTIVKWMKTDKTSGRQEFLSQWYVSGGNSSSDSLGMGTDGGLLKAYYRENGGSLGTLTGPNVADNNWHHIAYVKDSDEIRIYVDGSEVDQAAFSGSINSSSDLFLGFGMAAN